MINLIPTPPILPAFETIDVFETTFGDPLYLDYGGPNEIKFPDHTEIALDKAHNLIETPVTERDGTIKELMGSGDWQVQISYTIHAPIYSGTLGTATTNIDLSPFASAVPRMEPVLKQMNRIYRAKMRGEKLSVVNERLNALGIDFLFIKRISLPNNQTYYEQDVRLVCSQDTEYELRDLTSEAGSATPEPEAEG